MVTIKQISDNCVVVIDGLQLHVYAAINNTVHLLDSLTRKPITPVGRCLSADNDPIAATPKTLLSIVRRERKRLCDKTRKIQA